MQMFGTAHGLDTITILADDLTGACDAAAPFAGFGVGVEVSLDGHRPHSAMIVAHDLDARELSVAETYAAGREGMESNNGKTRVAIPTHFYKVLAFENGSGTLETLSILLPHDQTDLDGDDALDYLSEHVVRLSDVEAVTGLSFLPDWTGATAEADGLWVYSGTPAHSLVFAPCRATAGAG